MKEIKSISALAKKFRKMVRDFDVDPCYKSFQTTPHHDGSEHIEMHDGKFHYVITERGCENERIEGLSADDVLYLLFRSVALEMALRFERQNRLEGVDGRRISVAYSIDLMAKLNPAWGEKLAAYCDEPLREYPFNDDNSARPALPCAWASHSVGEAHDAAGGKAATDKEA